MHNTVPYISFTFDDFPRSALYTGGKILKSYRIRGTYYASLGLIGTQAPTGQIFYRDDIATVYAHGHELGCHTFGHCHSWETSPQDYEDSIKTNKRILNELVPDATFQSFSYPIIGPRPRTKRRVGRLFSCCRGGGQTYNAGLVDLNYLSAFFLEKRRDNPNLVKKLIDQNTEARGWLIFATHDISEAPTIYGCKPSFFEDVVAYSVSSGARILPIIDALEDIQSATHSASAKLLRL